MILKQKNISWQKNILVEIFVVRLIFLESAIKESEAKKAERVTELVLESIPPKVTYEPKNDIEKEIFSLNYTRPSVRLQGIHI